MSLNVKDSDICATAAGDNAAFCRLYEKYNSIMYRYAYSILHDHQASEDIVHDALINIIKSGEKYEIVNEKAWILSIVHNLAVSYIKKRSREFPTEKLPAVASPKSGLFYDIMELIPDKTDRQIVALRVGAKYKIKEIAELLGMKPNAVTKRYRKTLKYLKEHIQF